jgi:hypothetical protein
MQKILFKKFAAREKEERQALPSLYLFIGLFLLPGFIYSIFNKGIVRNEWKGEMIIFCVFFVDVYGDFYSVIAAAPSPSGDTA